MGDTDREEVEAGIGAQYVTWRAQAPLADGAKVDGTCFDSLGVDISSRHPMADQNTTPDKNPANDSASAPGADRNVPQDPDVGQQKDPESQKSSASRPRGHTEDPDRTL
jgi:hypothetical protein